MSARSEAAGARASLSAVHRLAWISIMAALTAAGGAVAIPVNPLSPVPITMQTLFVLLSGLILGPKAGAASSGLYLLAGIVGLPVFAGGKGGLAVLIGPTGGFLIGFPLASAISGLAKRIPPPSYPVIWAFCLLATAVTLGLGAVWLSESLDIGLKKALAAGVLPFIPGGLLKIAAAGAVYRFMAKKRLLPF